MYDTAMRVRLVKKRTREIELRKKKNRLQRLSVVCMLLAVSLVYAAVSMPGEPHMEKLEMYGTVLLHEGASGYVLTGVAAFSVAVIATVFCVRLYKNMRTRKHKGKVR